LGSSAEPRSDPLTHTFVATTDASGSVAHTYSWGNDANLQGWNVDQPLDLKTAKQAISNNWAERVDPALDPYIQSAFQDLNIPNNEHPNFFLFWNCKHEANNLIAQSQQERSDYQERLREIAKYEAAIARYRATQAQR